jgi:2'-hydroxyisoflavone reductase
VDLLILGGSVFLGRHLAEQALARGDRVTLFNRGQHSPELFPEAEKLRGDRDGGLEVLRGRHWDRLIDTSGYLPRIVRASAELGSTIADHYTFISTISVYADLSEPGATEEAPVGTLEDPTTEQITGESYGPLKALCEREVEQAMGQRALIVRPGLIVGPHDPSDRFTYWPHRVAVGGEVLAPGQPGHAIQVIDVRDLAAWVLSVAEAGQAGTYNATGPDYVLTMGVLLEACRQASDSAAQITWVDEQFLLDAGVTPWSELPLWVPTTDPSTRGFDAVDCTRAMRAGLRFRPIEETVQDTLAWTSARSAAWEWRAGLTQEREAEVLRAWHERSATA